MLDLQTTTPTVVVNTATKGELLTRAKAAIEDGEQSLREAAEALAIAQELHGASQAEMARAVGKSEAWVSRLLQWRRTGFKDESPFGPTTKAARLKHAKDRAASGMSKARKPRNSNTPADAPNSTASVDTGASTATDVDTSIPSKAKANLICAIDQCWPYLDDDEKREVIDYFLDKVDAWES